MAGDSSLSCVAQGVFGAVHMGFGTVRTWHAGVVL